jgi:hypothetical protein
LLLFKRGAFEREDCLTETLASNKLWRSYAASLFLTTASQAWGRAREVLHTFGYLKSMDLVLCRKNRVLLFEIRNKYREGGAFVELAFERDVGV